MAVPKKGQLMQFFVPLVDSTDFASVESAITESDFNSGVTKKFYGVNHGVSDAFTSGTISKTGRLVRSGVFQITMKGTENNYDVMQVRINKTGVNEAIINWINQDYDDSDIHSAITVVQSLASDAHSAAVQGSSRVLITQSMASDIISQAALLVSSLSDVYSLVSDLRSDFQSRVPKRVATDSQLSDMASDIKSAVAGITASVSASDISDIASAVWANTIGARVDSRLLLTQSRVSDVQSFLSDFQSDLLSLVTTTGVQLNASTMSDLRSAIATITASVSASDISDIASAVWANTIGARVDSRVLLNQSRISDVQSFLSDFQSDLLSVVNTTGVQLNASSLSDLRSAIAGIAATVSASDISDIASAVWAFSTGARVDSLVQLAGSRVSDIQSFLSDFQSDLLSHIDDTGVGLNASTLSDLRSSIAAITATVGASDISDIASAVRAILVSDFSDVLSAVTAVPTNLLDLADGVETGVTLRGAQRAMLAATTGKDSRSGNVVTYYAPDGTTVRVTVTAVCPTGRTTSTLTV